MSLLNLFKKIGIEKKVSKIDNTPGNPEKKILKKCLLDN
tara:strand:- start:395 stop:511 length:117 start_codon:yes stop_codon:yes gene_type:complete